MALTAHCSWFGLKSRVPQSPLVPHRTHLDDLHSCYTRSNAQRLKLLDNDDDDDDEVMCQRDISLGNTITRQFQFQVLVLASGTGTRQCPGGKLPGPTLTLSWIPYM